MKNSLKSEKLIHGLIIIIIFLGGAHPLTNFPGTPQPRQHMTPRSLAQILPVVDRPHGKGSRHKAGSWPPHWPLRKKNRKAVQEVHTFFQPLST